MDQRELVYIDMRDQQARADYINNAPEPTPGEPLPEVHQEVLVVPVPPRTTRGLPRTRQPLTDDKRSYVRPTLPQKIQLGVLFSEH